MPITFGSNISSILAQRQLARVSMGESASFERLSSGLRINKAADDAAGLSVSSQLNAKSRIFSQAMRNASDGISALSIAEGAVSGVNEILIRLRELAIGASNGTFSRTQRLSSDQEARALTEEYNRIVGSTTFNGLNLLNGGLGELRLQVGEGLSGSIGAGLGTELDRNVGNGSYTTNQTVDGTVASGQIDGDFNGDGRMDLVTNYGGTITLRTSKGDGTFTNTVLGSGVSSALVSGDFNGDGRQDFAVRTSAIAIDVYQGQGNGTFSTSSFSASSNISTFKAADVNNDGRSDLLITTTVANMTSHIAAAGGVFSSTPNYTFATSIGYITTGDLNGDGNIDIVNSGTTYLGAGNGTFASGITNGLSGSTELVDINRDGILDSMSFSSNNVTVNLGNGNGTFASATAYSLGATVYGIRSGDLNGDGILDVLTNANGQVKAIYGQSDGTFSAASSSLGSAGTFAGLLSIGDLNGDGAADYVNSGGASTNSFVGLANATQVTTIQRLNLTTAAEALSSLAVIDSALARTSAELGLIGSTQSRLSTALSTLASTRENYHAASARITDIDVASEAAELVRYQTLKQTSAAVLAQANQAPALALQLLKL